MRCPTGGPRAELAILPATANGGGRAASRRDGCRRGVLFAEPGLGLVPSPVADGAPHGVYLATGRGAVDGWLLRVPATVLRDLTTAWFPFGAHPCKGVYGTRARSSRWRGGAPPSSPSARSPPVSRTRSTTPVAAALEDACGALLSSVVVDCAVSGPQFRARRAAP
jgi:hypothetical protein